MNRRQVVALVCVIFAFACLGVAFWFLFKGRGDYALGACLAGIAGGMVVQLILRD